MIARLSVCALALALTGCAAHAKRPPVRVECARPSSSPCRTVLDRLGAAGVPAAEGQAGLESGHHTVRVLVGRWPLGADPDAGRVSNPPTVRHAGLVAVLARAGQSPVVVVTGADDAGLSAAARALPLPIPAAGYVLTMRATS